jgi:hypothetical protein
MRILTEHVQKITNTSVTLKTRVKVMEDPIAPPEAGTADPAGPADPGGYDYGPGYDAGVGFESQPVPGTVSSRDAVAPVEPQAADIASVVEKDPVVRALVENLGGKVVGIRRRKESPQGEKKA